MHKKKFNWKSWSFIILAVVTVISLLLMTFVYVPLATEGIENPWDPVTWNQMLIARSPYIVQCIINLLLFLIICACGSVLYSNRIKVARNSLLTIGIISCISALFLHSMVYGVDLFIPSTYSLFAPYNRTFGVFSGLHTGFFFDNLALNHLFSVIIHIFAPQVLLGLFVSFLAIKKYKRMLSPQ